MSEVVTVKLSPNHSNIMYVERRRTDLEADFSESLSTLKEKQKDTLKAGSQYTQHVASRRAVSHRAASAPQCIALFGSQLTMRLCAMRWVATKSALPPRNY